MLETAAAIAITVALVEVIKRGGLQSKYAPMVSLVVGIVIVFVSSSLQFSSDVLINGIVVGLSASGLYSGGKATIAQ